MFLVDERFWNLAHVLKGPRIFGLWLMFLEDQRFWILAHVLRDLGFLGFGSCFQESKDFWKVLFMLMCVGLLPLYLQNKYFQLVTELFIEKNMAYLANGPSLGHIPCFDECWGWIVRLMLHHWKIWRRIIAFCS